ncbi:MAG: hypothetical protein ACLUI3_10020 [Christensenellales bacterium]
MRTAQVRTLAIGMNDMPGSGDNGLLTVQEQRQRRRSAEPIWA